MWQIYLIAAIAGWVGGFWIDWSKFDPTSGDIGPPGCIYCNGLFGAIAAIILVAIPGVYSEAAGVGVLLGLSVVAGRFGATLVNGARRMMG